MAISVKHSFQSAKADGPDSTLVQPSSWNAEHTITAAAGKVLGRDTSGAGAIQELPLSVDASGNLTIPGNFTTTGGTLGGVKAGGLASWIATTDWTDSPAQNGYTKLPNGIIIQWGRINKTSNGSQAFTFPIAFPSSCAVVVLTVNYASAFSGIPSVTAKSTTGFTSTSGNFAATYYELYVAIGY